MKRLLVVVWLLCHFALLQAQSKDDGYVSIDGLKKSLGVNMKFKVPKGWEEIHSELPRVVKGYSNGGAMFYIAVIESQTFVSRNEFRNQNVENFVNQLETETRNEPDLIEYTEISHDLVTIDKYPFIVISSDELRRSDPFLLRCQVVRYFTCYEDRTISIYFFNYYADPKSVSSSVAYITSSIIFPDQYSVY